MRVRERSGGGGVGRECRGGDGGGGRERWRRTLVALGEQAEGVDLVHEVGHARPPPEAEPHQQHPHHHEGVDGVGACPPAHELGRRLHRVLQRPPAAVADPVRLRHHEETVKSCELGGGGGSGRGEECVPRGLRRRGR